MKIIIILMTVCAVIAVDLTERRSFGVEPEVARVFAVSGDVKIVPAGSKFGIEAERGMALNPGDWIRTGENSSATVAFDVDAENVLSIQSDSLVIVELDGYFKVQLLEGRINAILEGVKDGEVFRVLAPSVVAESANSGWVVSAEGDQSTVVVVDGIAYVCGVDPDGNVKKERFEIREGYQRTTRLYENPSPLTAAPASIMDWFRERLIEHHLSRVLARGLASIEEGERFAEDTGSFFGGRGALVDGEEIDILEYIYRGRLGRSWGAGEITDTTGMNRE